MPRMPQKQSLVAKSGPSLAPQAGPKPPPPPPPGPPLLVETPNYRMRSLRPNDAGQNFKEWLSDKDMLQGLNLAPVEWTTERLQRYIASFDNKRKYIVGIFDKAEGPMIGFYTIDVNLLHRTAQLTAGLGNKDYWGKNVFAETARSLLDHLFQYRDVDKVTARIMSSNKRMFFNFMNSRRFFFEARLREEILTPAGKRIDVFSFAALKSGVGAKPVADTARPG